MTNDECAAKYLHLTQNIEVALKNMTTLLEERRSCFKHLLVIYVREEFDE